MAARAVSWVLCLLLLSSLRMPTARAAVVSRLGGLYLYDPLTFDSGVLQWGGTVRGGTGQGDPGHLEVGAEAPFYRELSVRVAHQQAFQSGEDGHRLTWRLRTPVIQSTRYGRLDTTQLYYIGGIALRAPDPRAPAHEAGGAWVTARDRLSQHLQAAATVRDRVQAGPDGARAGLAVREALLLPPGRPHAGPAQPELPTGHTDAPPPVLRPQPPRTGT